MIRWAISDVTPDTESWAVVSYFVDYPDEGCEVVVDDLTKSQAQRIVNFYDNQCRVVDDNNFPNLNIKCRRNEIQKVTNRQKDDNAKGSIWL